MPAPIAARARDLAARAYRRARSGWHALRGWPLVRQVRALQLRRLSPLANGRERGQPVIREYWNRFMDAHRADVRGRAVEIGSTLNLRRCGGPAMTKAEAMDVAPRDGITVVADLSRADHLAPGQFDTIVAPFTMHMIYDVEAALYHAIRLLAPGGVLLVNFTCVDDYYPTGLDMGTGRPLFVFWWFTPIHVETLLRGAGLAPADFTLTIDGNLFARIAHQVNLPAEELSTEERDRRDARYPLLISARIVKPAGWSAAPPAYRDPVLPDAPPAAWRR